MSRSYSIRLMERMDVRQCMALTNLMSWGLEVEDFSFMMKLEPKGCFVAEKDGDIIGVITSISLDLMGWVGNVIVAPEERKKGIGAALVSEALDYLETRGVTTIGLYAYRNVVPFYESLGLKANRDFSWLICRDASWSSEEMPILNRRDFQAVIEFDEDCYGASRERLLEAIYGSPQSRCTAIFEDGKPITYLMVAKLSTSAEIGPWTCIPRREEEAFNLFRSLGNELHGLEAHVGVPSDRSDIIDFLSSLDFVEEFPVVRMFHGPIPPERNCVLAMESLERG